MKKKKATAAKKGPAKKTTVSKTKKGPAKRTPKAKAWSTTIPLSIGSDAITLHVTLDYEGISTGSTIELTCNNTGTNPPIAIPPFQVTQPAGRVGINVQAPAGYAAELTYTLMNNTAAGTSQPEGSYVELVVSQEDGVVSAKAGVPPPKRYLIIKKSKTTN